MPFDLPAAYYETYTVVGGLMLIILATLAWRSQNVLLLMIWVIATALPASLSTEPRLFPRYWYLPAVASSILTAIGLTYLFNRIPNRRYARVAGISCCVILLMASIAKSRYFEGKYLINTANYHRDHRKEPEAAIPYT